MKRRVLALLLGIAMLFSEFSSIPHAFSVSRALAMIDGDNQQIEAIETAPEVELFESGESDAEEKHSADSEQAAEPTVSETETAQQSDAEQISVETVSAETVSEEESVSAIEPIETLTTEAIEAPAVEMVETPAAESIETPLVETTEAQTEALIVEPTVEPTVEATAEPTVEPTIEPTVEPTAEPTVEPTVEATVEPTIEPTAEPTVEPTVEPEVEPTAEPTIEPTVEPTIEPTVEPTTTPTVEPAATEEPELPLLEAGVRSGIAYLFAGEGSIPLTVKVSGGVAPFVVEISISANGEVVDAQRAHLDTEGVLETVYAPQRAGDHVAYATVTDAAGQEVSAKVTVPVAAHDVEYPATWEATIDHVELTGDWREDLVAMAQSQLGYQESRINFIIENGARRGYTRYGDWYGAPYTDWCGAFISFCLSYAGISKQAYPQNAGVAAYMEAIDERGALEENDYMPQRGDLVFLMWEGEETPSHMGIVENADENTVWTIEGNAADSVARKSYALDAQEIIAYANTTELMRQAGVDEEKTAEPDVRLSGEAITAKDSVNMRSQAKQGSSLVRKLREAGTPVQLLGATDQEDARWYLVQYHDAIGYIRGDLLMLAEEAPEADEAPAEEPTAESETEPVEEPTAESETEPVEEPMVEPETEPVEEPTVTPETELVEEPTVEPETVPDEELAQGSADEPEEEPTLDPEEEQTNVPEAEQTVPPEGETEPEREEEDLIFVPGGVNAPAIAETNEEPANVPPAEQTQNQEVQGDNISAVEATAGEAEIEPEEESGAEMEISSKPDEAKKEHMIEATPGEAEEEPELTPDDGNEQMPEATPGEADEETVIVQDNMSDGAQSANEATAGEAEVIRDQTPEKVYYCGLEEHEHSFGCFILVWPFKVCTLEEHTHDQSCEMKPMSVALTSDAERFGQGEASMVTVEAVTMDGEAPYSVKVQVYVDDALLMNAQAETAEETLRFHFKPVQTGEYFARVTVTDAKGRMAEAYLPMLITMPEEPEYYCGLRVHDHGAGCYDELGKLICILEEHRHDLYCLAEKLTIALAADDQTLDYNDPIMPVDVNAAISGGVAPYELEMIVRCEESGAEENLTHMLSAAAQEQEATAGEAQADCAGYVFTFEPAATGEHTVILNVTDADGRVAQETISVDIVRVMSEWEESIMDVPITGDAHTDIPAIAQSQLGYTESEVDLVFGEDEIIPKSQVYTRYGEWYGEQLDDWNALFMAFCLHYAGLTDYPFSDNVEQWMQQLESRGMLASASSYMPAEGELAFIDTDADGAADRIAIITGIQANSDTIVMTRSVGPAILKDGDTIVAIAGDVDGQVQETEYDAGEVVAYGVYESRAAGDPVITGDFYHDPGYLYYEHAEHAAAGESIAFVLIPADEYSADWTPSTTNWTAKTDANYVVTYCADRFVKIGTSGTNYNSFVIDNSRFGTDEVRRNLAGVIAHSYPFITEEEMRAELMAAYENGEITAYGKDDNTVVDISDCTVSEYIGAAQAAIWYLLNPGMEATFTDFKKYKLDSDLQSTTIRWRDAATHATTNETADLHCGAIMEWLLKQSAPVELGIENYTYSVTQDETYGLYDLKVDAVLNREVIAGEIVSLQMVAGALATEQTTLEAGTTAFSLELKGLTRDELLAAEVMLEVSGQRIQAYYYDCDNYQDMVGGQWEGYRSDLSFNVTTESTSVSVAKHWADGAPEDGTVVSVRLYANGTHVREIGELSAENNWTYTWEPLSKYDVLGNAIEYTIAEDVIEGYYSVIDRVDDSLVTIPVWEKATTLEPGNRYMFSAVPGALGTLGNKTLMWLAAHPEDASACDPGMIWTAVDAGNGEVYLDSSNGHRMAHVSTYVLSSTGTKVYYRVTPNASATDSNLVTFKYAYDETAGTGLLMGNYEGIENCAFIYIASDSSGNNAMFRCDGNNAYAMPFTLYKLTEKEVPPAEICYVLTNTKIAGGELTNLRVSKVWAGREDGVYPQSVTVQLMQNGRPYGAPAVLSADNNWSCEDWHNLPLTDNDGNAFVYTFEEPELEGYTLSTEIIEEETGIHHVVTNTWTPEVVSAQLRKVSLNDENQLLAGARFDLYQVSLGETGDPIPGLDGVLGFKVNEVPIETGDDGTVQLMDLAVGETYYLVETMAPFGFNLLRYPIGFTVEKRELLILLTLVSETPWAEAIPGTSPVLMVRNELGVKLPSTGGAGTDLYTMGGILLMAASIFLLYNQRKYRKEDYET